MKILQLANKFPYPPKDGGSIATLNFSRSLARLGHRVTILAMNTSKHYTDPDSVPDELSKMVQLLAVPVNTDIRIDRLLRNFVFSSFPYNAQRFISRAYSERLERLLGEEEFDIIQLEGLYLAPYLSAIRRLSKAIVVMRAHNIEHEIWERTSHQQRGWKGMYLQNLAGRIRRMELDYMNGYDAVLPITSRDGEMLRNLGCRIPMHIVPTGIDAAELEPDHSQLEYPAVFHIGALDWSPNLEGLDWFFTKVWPQVIRQFPDLKFYLAGRNAPPYLRNARHANLVFLGEVDNAYDFIRSKAVMIVPVLSGSGMRIKIVEGMALGKSIVTTSIGTEGISTTHRENIMIADDPVDFAAAVCELVENHGLFEKIGENAVTFVKENYDNLSITKSCTDFLETLR